ncbi:endonuclease/exonuclease/phosphatase family protein [Haloplanus halobius]|uniref:endonuclease/exonuclease/phosphatase family protein n=1 Tax=Haloplanus halobius TaxID=2934938 RepID=UPI00200ECA4B
MTVATRNCYLGADLFRLLTAVATDETTLQEAVGNLVTTVDRSHVSRRLDAIAAELERTAPDLVGLQEVALVRTDEPDDASTPTATNVRYDFRTTLLAAIEERNLPYRPVAATKTADFQLPAVVDGDRMGVRLTDHDVILARDGVTTGDPTTGTFDAAFSMTRSGQTVTIRRGYGIVAATVGGTRLTFCNTHLESVSAEARRAQAAELQGLLDDHENPTVLVGDLNSGPGATTDVYDALAGAFTDAAPEVGNTCCHASTLRNATPSLDSRVDHTLVRGDLRATEATRVGADPATRIAVDDERLWPSDHAGVVTTLTPASAVTTATPTETPTTSPTPDITVTPTATPELSAASGPGFGVAAGALSVLAALAARGQHDDD